MLERLFFGCLLQKEIFYDTKNCIKPMIIEKNSYNLFSCSIEKCSMHASLWDCMLLCASYSYEIFRDKIDMNIKF